MEFMEKINYKALHYFLILILLNGCFSDQKTQPIDNKSNIYNIKEVYGISKTDYAVFSNLEEKKPSFYINMINDEVYQWYSPFGNPESDLYKQGKWIYPYLIEKLSNTENKTQGIYYPDEAIKDRSVLVKESEISSRISINIKRLYIDKNYYLFLNNNNFYSNYTELEENINKIVDSDNIKNIKIIQIKLLKEYCKNNIQTIYCKNEFKKFIKQEQKMPPDQPLLLSKTHK